MPRLPWLGTLRPLWEERYSKHFPPPPGQTQRRLLRPVYWLGNWQFACLDYYRPPKGVKDRCVRAEPFPPVLQRQVEKIEALARRMFRGPDMPPRWHLNTCLVNFYGNRLEDGRWVDTARVVTPGELWVHLPLNGSADDASGNGRHARLQGGMSFGAGRAGANCAIFDGSNGHVALPTGVVSAWATSRWRCGSIRRSRPR